MVVRGIQIDPMYMSENQVWVFFKNFIALLTIRTSSYSFLNKIKLRNIHKDVSDTPRLYLTSTWHYLMKHPVKLRGKSLFLFNNVSFTPPIHGFIKAPTYLIELLCWFILQHSTFFWFIVSKNLDYIYKILWRPDVQFLY